MLDKAGKADVGDAVKTVGLIGIMGVLILTVGGSITVFVGEDDTGIPVCRDVGGAVIVCPASFAKDSNGNVQGKCTEKPEKSNQYECTEPSSIKDRGVTGSLGYVHGLGTTLVKTVAYWSIFIGLGMMVIGFAIVLLARQLKVVIGTITAVSIPVIYFAEHIPLEIMIAGYSMALFADVLTTIRSKRFPSKELNPIISKFAMNSTRRAWSVYGLAYVAIGCVSFMVLGNPVISLGILMAAHASAAAWNALTEPKTTLKAKAC